MTNARGRYKIPLRIAGTKDIPIESDRAISANCRYVLTKRPLGQSTALLLPLLTRRSPNHSHSYAYFVLQATGSRG